MPFDFKFPDVGEGIQEGEIIKWLVKENEEIKEDQPIVQIETDKAVVDLPSPSPGKILKINFKEGNKVKVGETLVVIGDKNEKINIARNEKNDIIAGKKGKSVVGELEEAEDIEMKPHSVAVKGIQQSQKIITSPAIRKLAADRGIDLTKIKGSGENGRILKSDLDKINEKRSPQQQIPVKKTQDNFGFVEKIPLKGIRKTISDNMKKSLDNSAQITIMDDIDISEVGKIREKEEKLFVKENKEIKLTFLPFIIKAVIAALKEHPILNSSLAGEEIIIKKYFNIGLAVDTEVGLMVPVIKNAEHKSILQLTKEIQTLTERARTRKITIEELKDSSFTVSNYGSIAGKYATPILNPEEAGVLGIGRIFDLVSYEKNKIKNRKILPISLTFDHRILDGAEASKFVRSLKIFLEDPDHLLMKIR